MIRWWWLTPVEFVPEGGDAFSDIVGLLRRARLCATLADLTSTSYFIVRCLTAPAKIPLPLPSFPHC